MNAGLLLLFLLFKKALGTTQFRGAPLLLSAPRGGGLLPLAAQQLRRYLHELDRRVAPFPIISSPVFSTSTSANGSAVVHLAVAASCPPGVSYVVARPAASFVALLACDDLGRGALYAANDLLTALGVLFTAEGPPFLPASARAHAVAAQTSPGSDGAAYAHALAARVLAAAASLRAAAAPAFQYRGFQPWGSYPIGNDWWDRDEYRRVVELVVSLKGNWIGMHSYPCHYSFPEPGVWVDSTGGESANILPSGNLTPAAGAPPQCAASWAATLRPSWGARPFNTSSLHFGAALLFERDCFTNRELTAAGVCGVPGDAAANAASHNAVANLYKSVFAFAARLGVSTALGTEVPLASATPLQLRTYWSGGRFDTFVTPTACAECPPPGDKDAYALLGVADAFLLPDPGEGLVPLDCYWFAAGTDAWLGVANATLPPAAGYAFVRREGYALAQPGGAATPTVPLFQYVRANFSKVGGVDTWLVVGDAGAAAAEARGYAPLGGARAPVAHALTTPPAAASAFAAYTDAFTRLERLYGRNLTWYWAWSPESWQWDKIKQDAPEVVAAAAQIPAMAAAAAAANVSFGVALGGWTLGPYDNRTFFDALAPQGWPMASLDGYLGTNPPEAEFGALSPARPRWSFPWAEDDEDLTGVQLWVSRNLAHAAVASKLGVTGHGSLQWRTRTVSPALTAVASYPWNTTLAPDDFLSSYAAAAFGGGAAGSALGALLSDLDSAGMPRPVHCDPGCMAPSTSFCGAGEAPYAFVDAWLAQRGAVAAGGDPAALERFDYWGAHFFHLRAMARAQCGWGTYAAALRAVEAAPAGSPQQRALAVSLGFPAFAAMVANFSQLMWAAQGAAASYGDLGVLFQLYGDVAGAAGGGALAALEGLAGDAACGAPCALPDGYAPTAGAPAPYLRVFSARTILERGEPFNVRVHAVGGAGCERAGTACTAFARAAGAGGAFASTPLPHEGAGRAVFYAPVPLPQGAEEAGLEWYASCACAGGAGEPLMFPPGAPAQPASVVFI